MGTNYPPSAQRSRMKSMVVPASGFPCRRKPHCCGALLKRGDSVLVVDGKNLESPVVLHRRCLVKFIEKMPFDTDDYNIEFERIRHELMNKDNLL